MTALVDAIERGRGATAASSGPLNEVSALFAQALADAEDGMFGHAAAKWRELCERLVGQDAELGRRGASLGAALFTAARSQTDGARQRGFQRAFDVLEHAMRSLKLAGDSDTHREASLLAARICDAWQQSYEPDTPEHLQLIALAASLRRTF